MSCRQPILLAAGRMNVSVQEGKLGYARQHLLQRDLLRMEETQACLGPGRKNQVEGEGLKKWERNN